jgi:hypothetical protein
MAQQSAQQTMKVAVLLIKSGDLPAAKLTHQHSATLFSEISRRKGDSHGAFIH